MHDVIAADESATAPIAAHVEHPLPAPADTWRGGRVETWHSLMDDGPVAPTANDEPDPVPEPIAQHDGHAPWRSILDQLLDDTTRVSTSDAEPIEFARNGFHVEPEQDLRVPPAPSPRRGRHSRVEARSDDDPGTYGRHSMHLRD